MLKKNRIAPRPDSSGAPHDFSDDQLKEAAIRTIRVYVKIGNKMFGCNMPVPGIDFDLCEMNAEAAGMATGDSHINLNMVLFRDNVEHVLNGTAPHEVAHLFQHHIFGRKGVNVQGHGVEWQEIMRKLGKNPYKYHDLDTTKAKEHFKKVNATKKKAAKYVGD